VGNKDVQVDNGDGKRLYGVLGERSADVAILRGDKIFIQIEDVSNPTVLDQILSTFKFIEPNAEHNIINIPEVNLKISLPKSTLLIKNDELNRLGSFASYDFSGSSLGNAGAGLNEILFFSKESFNTWLDICRSEGLPCYLENLQTKSSFQKQQATLINKENTENLEAKIFNNRAFLVGNKKIYVDIGYNRSYVTYFGDVRAEVWIWLESESNSSEADELFKNISFIENS